MDAREFERLIGGATGKIAGMALDGDLQEYLEQHLPADGEWFTAVENACREADAAGWMCQHERGGIRFGRVIKPGTASHGFSVDVVDMNDVVGPHHRHPGGEIDMIMPIDPGAEFDGHGRGWCVYEPGSDHFPSVDGGEALVLYLLPQGQIEFTGREA